jgi:AAA family ATP:ADP antiporter
MLARLARTLQLEPEELRRAILLGGLLFALTSSYTLVKTARDALFLSTLPASLLPWVFLGVGALSLVTSGAITAVHGRRPTAASLARGALGSAVSLVLFAWLILVRQPWVPVVFYLWVNLYGLILMSQFWSHTNAVSNPREAKRTFGLIGTGGVLGGLAGGLLAAPLAGRFGLSALLIAGATLMAMLGWGVPFVSRRSASASSEEREPEGHTAGHPIVIPYVRWLALAALCSVVVSSLLDFAFKVELQRRYPDSEEIAAFLGAFYTVVNLAALGVQLFLSRWALQVLGAGWSAAVLPTGLGLAAVVNAFLPGFASVVSGRLWDQVMRLSLNRSAVELFYFPLEPGLRQRVRTFIQAGLERVGDALAGLLVLGIGMMTAMTGHAVMILIAAIVVAWIAAWAGVRRGYVRELGRNLKRLNLAPAQMRVSLREASLLKEMTQLLESPHELVALSSIAMLEDNAPEILEEHLPALLDHPAGPVRARALRVAAARRVMTVTDRIRERLHDPDPRVRVEALRAHCALERDNPAEAVEEFLASNDPRMRIAAIQSIAEFCPIEQEPRARIMLERLIAEGGAEERAAVADALGRRPAPSLLHDLLGTLLDDSDLETRRAALRSAGAAERRNHIPKLLEALNVRRTQEAARAGLAAWGDRVVGTLGDYLCDASVEPGIRHAITRVLGDIQSQEAANALLRCREIRDVRLEYRVLKAMNRIRAANPGVAFPRARVSEDIERDVRAGMFAYVHYRACPIGGRQSAERLFCIALNERVDQALNRVFRRLALVYPPDEILAAYRGTISDDRRARGSAFEFLENALTPELRGLVLPFVDDSGDEGRLRFAEQRFGLHFLGFEQSLREVAAAEDQWLRTCALFVIGSRKESSLMPSVMEALSALDPRVRETANWATLTLATGEG